MKKMTVKYELDTNSPPPLTASQKAEVTALRSKADSEINVSDIPPLSDEFWKSAVRNPFYKPTKTVTTVRVDSDVLMWLKSQGKGYQTRLNIILREAMLKEVTKA